MLIFEMSLEVAEEFYRRCEARKANTLEVRMEIMKELAREGLLRNVTHTNRTPDQVAKDMAKNFGDVLYIKPKGDSDADDGH